MRPGVGSILREGLVAGLLGAAAVAAWFFIVDFVNGQPLLTPAALGSAVILGAESLAEVRVNAVTVLGYTAVHFVAFGLLGVVAALFVAKAAETPHLLLLGMVLFVVLTVHIIGLLAIVAEFLLGALAWWAIALGNLFAALAMGAFFLKRHPRIRTAFGADPFET